jgi:hypothetical protein
MAPQRPAPTQPYHQTLRCQKVLHINTRANSQKHTQKAMHTSTLITNQHGATGTSLNGLHKNSLPTAKSSQ